MRTRAARTRTTWMLAGAGVIAATSLFAACGGDDYLGPLPVFDGGLDATITFDAANIDASGFDSSGEFDATPADGGDASTDAGRDASVDAGHDSGTVDAGTPDGGVDSGADAGEEDAGLDAGEDADAGPVVVNGCTSFSDQSGAGGTRVVQGPPNSAPVQYSPNCIQVAVGQSVTFQQNAFADHPLDPAGGDTPTPIVSTTTGDTVTFTFSNAGTFGFQCRFHPGLMFGAVKVVP